jgi:hypothetical protein
MRTVTWRKFSPKIKRTFFNNFSILFHKVNPGYTLM